MSAGVRMTRTPNNRSTLRDACSSAAWPWPASPRFRVARARRSGACPPRRRRSVRSIRVTPSERPRRNRCRPAAVDGDRVLTKGIPSLPRPARGCRSTRQPGADAVVGALAVRRQCRLPPPGRRRGARRDPNFQGYGVAKTDAGGAFHFRTIRPVAYPGRTPHIHVRVQAATGGFSPRSSTCPTIRATGPTSCSRDSTGTSRPR